jgi:hypothetical protein
MKLLRVYVLLLIALPLSVVWAQEPAQSATAEKLLLLLNTDEMVDQIFEQMKQVLVKELPTMNLSQEQMPIMEKYLSKQFDLIQSEMSWEKMKDDYISVYTSTFTEEELSELVKFYESPAGRKFSEKLPMLMQQSMAIGQKQMQKILPKLQELQQEMLTELKNAK